MECCHQQAPPEEPLDLRKLDQILEQFKGRKGATIPILQQTQEAFGYLPKEALRHISDRANIPLQQLYGVATFYTQFHLTRRGRHIVRICDGTACHVRGAPKNIEAMESSIGVAPGQTSPDYRYTFEIVYCLGSCGLAPVAVVDEKVLGRLGPDTLTQNLKALP